MKRVYEPNKDEGKLDTVITQLYLLVHALKVENSAKLEERINKIRALLLELKDNINKD